MPETNTEQLPALVEVERAPPTLPPDPAAYDSQRASQARARGLSAPYIAGGRDHHPDVGGDVAGR